MSDDNGSRADRILAYMMLDGMPPDATNAQKTLRLSQCGFPNGEIAEILDISATSVTTNLHSARKAKGTTAKKKPASKKTSKR